METDFQNQLKNISTHKKNEMHMTTYQKTFGGRLEVPSDESKIKKMSCLVAEFYK
jgi:hypothetical protein